MFLRNLSSPWAVAALVLLGTLLFAQSGPQTNSLMVRGYEGQAPVVTVEGRHFVDVEALAQITSGSVGFRNGRLELTLPAATGNAPESPSRQGFSRQFMTGAIETIASMREWGSTLVVAIQNGYPVGNAMSVYRGRAMDRLRIASASVSTDVDRRGMELLQNEFNNVQAWSHKLVNAQRTMSAGDLSTSEDALKDDELYQKIVQCGQFLGPMLASGAFQDDPSCH
jgi:hypothetical protein